MDISQYGAWSLARSRAQCAVRKAAEKCINHIQWGREKKKKKKVAVAGLCLGDNKGTDKCYDCFTGHGQNSTGGET